MCDSDADNDVPFEFLDPGRLIDQELELVLVGKASENPEIGIVPTYEFEMIAGQNLKLGFLDLRVGNTDTLVLYRGHMGYGVEPEHRGNRYAARSCKLILPLAKRHGLTTLWITSDPDNKASRRTCEIVGADFVEIVQIPEDHDMRKRGDFRKCRYRIDLDAI